MRAWKKVAVAVLMCCLTGWAGIPLAVGQDKPAGSGAPDPRLKSLVGTWEGRVELKTSMEEPSRVLVIREKAGQLEGRWGIPGKGLERVVLSTELDGSRPKISFKNKAGNTYALELVKEDWLSGKMVLTGGGRGTSATDRPVQLERKKK